MASQKLAAVAIAAIVIIAGVAAVFYLYNNNSADTPDNNLSSNTEGRLAIFGNANNDDYIDEKTYRCHSVRLIRMLMPDINL